MMKKTRGVLLAAFVLCLSVVSVTAQTYRFRTTGRDFARATAISPLLGLQYNTGRSIVMGGVGYSFVNTDLPAGFPGARLQSGSEDGVFVLGQVNYWGDGTRESGVIVVTCGVLSDLVVLVDLVDLVDLVPFVRVGGVGTIGSLVTIVGVSCSRVTLKSRSDELNADPRNEVQEHAVRDMLLDPDGRIISHTKDHEIYAGLSARLDYQKAVIAL